MKNFFEHTSASWVRYSNYEWKKTVDGKEYLLPTKDARPQPYDPMTVADDGSGFDTAAARKEGHYGLSGMERRTAELGGKITISSKIGEGTTVRIALPL